MEKRALDPDENVRLEVVQAIIAAFKKDVSAVQGELQIKLLDVVKNRTLDKKVRLKKNNETSSLTVLLIYVYNGSRLRINNAKETPSYKWCSL